MGSVAVFPYGELDNLGHRKLDRPHRATNAVAMVRNSIVSAGVGLHDNEGGGSRSVWPRRNENASLNIRRDTLLTLYA